MFNNKSKYYFNGMVIYPTSIKNTDESGSYRGLNFNTEDQVFLYGESDIKNKTPKENASYATDYAVMCGAPLYSSNSLGYDRIWYKNKRTTCKMCRSGVVFDDVDCIDFEGCQNTVNRGNMGVAISPVLKLDLEHFMSALTAGRIRIEENKEGGYHTVTIGLEFPKSYVGKELDEKLSLLKSNGQLKKTGAKFTGFMRPDKGNDSFVQNEEYVFNGEKYVLVEVIDGGVRLEDVDEDSFIKVGKYAWAKVEPITFRIRNWNALPNNINPEGNGWAGLVELEAEEGIIAGIPFDPYPIIYGREEDWHLLKHAPLYQNSPCRAWLNGYNLHKEIDQGNGNKLYKGPVNFDFEGKGFLYEATHGLGRQIGLEESKIQMGFEELI